MLFPNGWPTFDGNPEEGEDGKGKGEDPKLGAPPVESPVAIEARKGLADPPPVTCGLRPTPNIDPPVKPPVAPVGWLFKKLKLFP